MSVHVAVDGAVGTLTLDAPPLNLLSDALRAALLDALGDFRARRLRARRHRGYRRRRLVEAIRRQVTRTA